VFSPVGAAVSAASGVGVSRIEGVSAGRDVSVEAVGVVSGVAVGIGSSVGVAIMVFGVSWVDGKALEVAPPGVGEMLSAGGISVVLTSGVGGCSWDGTIAASVVGSKVASGDHAVVAGGVAVSAIPSDGVCAFNRLAELPDQTTAPAKLKPIIRWMTRYPGRVARFILNRTISAQRCKD
jgi:hypothetical protein